MSEDQAAPERTSRRGRRPRREQSRASRIAYGVIGVVGELLITVGVLLFGFLVWQLWWTDVQGNRAQAQVVQELVREPAPSATPSDGGTAKPVVAKPRHDDPPVMKEPKHAVTFATMRVPRWKGEPERPISEGTDRPTVLDPKGVGHYEGTAMPGDVGNFAVAGHRTTFAKPFNRIAELKKGDAVVVRTATLDGGPGTDTWYVYKVVSTQIVAPTDVGVIAPVPNEPGTSPTERYMTMTTCHPMFSARERYIVHLKLDYWAPVSDGTPAELLKAAS
ncbi:class E sortase [Cellulomonas sp. HZM]|uniref:class E sortase n=1 Tax=Cellulomonas sp. HZM TaxID=1454010 RepID=UPI0006903E8D|nr:class E sortase [Cellulomonas sp. HZM]